MRRQLIVLVIGARAIESVVVAAEGLLVAHQPPTIVFAGRGDARVIGLAGLGADWVRSRAWSILLGLILTLLAFAGGLFVPLSLLPGGVQAVAKWTPEFGLNQLVHAPLLNQGVHLAWVANVLIWLVIFGGGAIWLFRRDTARV